MKTKTGFYLLSKKLAPTGANRVDFAIRGNMVSINHEPFRVASKAEIDFLRSKIIA